MGSITSERCKIDLVLSEYTSDFSNPAVAFDSNFYFSVFSVRDFQ